MILQLNYLDKSNYGDQDFLASANMAATSAFHVWFTTESHKSQSCKLISVHHAWAKFLKTSKKKKSTS